MSPTSWGATNPGTLDSVLDSAKMMPSQGKNRFENLYFKSIFLKSIQMDGSWNRAKPVLKNFIKFAKPPYFKHILANVILTISNFRRIKF